MTRFLAGALAIAVAIAGCAQIRDITNALSQLSNLQFKLGSVNNFRLAGVELAKVSDPKRLSISDGLSLTQAFARKSLPASFTLNVEARNPNTGQGGTRKTSVTLTGLDWRLLIDDVPTITGNIERSVEIPGNQQASIVPLGVGLDLYEFFGNRGYDGLMNLAMAVGGASGSSANLKLDAKPTVTTPFGPMTYPKRLTIVDKEFRGS
ncbi:MAG: hypothetical protein FGM24_00180 [Candidatus Kapabacteria bacterium]|nr:hypothetical protein [Candidatus Kapabacteria bacterium]